MNKIGSVVFCFLIVSSTLIFPIQSDAFQQDEIIYVDDDNIDGPWDGSIEHPFQYIQDGIAAAIEGDTVFVRNGQYKENIVIDQSIFLRGEHKVNTIIDGGKKSNVICIEDDEVEVSNFFITNAGIHTFDAGIKLFSSENSISENIIDNNMIGIFLQNSSNNLITENIFLDGQVGLHLNFSSNFNFISKNSFSNLSYGMSLSYSTNNILVNNTLNTSRYGMLIGLESLFNEVSENIVCNSECGIFLDSSNNNISFNYISNNHDGIRMDEHSSSNTIYENLIVSNWGGISLYESTNNNKISSNVICNNTIGVGLYLSNTNEIKENNFIDNSYHVDMENSFFNTWKMNYWDDWIGFGPKLITGKVEIWNVGIFPWFEFDWHPAQEPYDLIGGGYE